MDLDAVEPGCLAVLRSLDVVGDDPRQLVAVQRPRRRDVLEAVRGEGLHIRLHRRRRDRQRPARLQVGMRDPADMPELQEDLAAFGVDGVVDLLPGFHLLVGEDAGRPGVAAPFRRDVGRLGDDQAGAGALAVIFDVDVLRNLLVAGARARQRRHHDAVRQVVRAEVVGLEEFGRDHCGLPCWMPRRHMRRHGVAARDGWPLHCGKTREHCVLQPQQDEAREDRRRPE